MRLLRAAIAAALLCSSTLAAAQVGPPPYTAGSDGVLRSSVPAYLYCSTNGGITWAPCPPSGGSGGSDPSWTGTDGVAPSKSTLGIIGGVDTNGKAQWLLTDPAGRPYVNLASAIFGSAGSGSPFQQGLGAATAASSNVYIGGQFSPLLVQQADKFTTPQSVPATSGTVYSLALPGGQGTAALTISGLTAAAAVVTASYSDDGGAHTFPVRFMGTATVPGTTTISADGSYSFALSGHTNLYLTVTTAGSGSFTVASNLSLQNREVNLGGAGTASTNPLWFASLDGAQATVGSKADAACASSTATCSMIAVMKAIMGAAQDTTTPSPTNLKQVGGAAFALGQANSAGSLPVVLASDWLMAQLPSSLGAKLSAGSLSIAPATDATFPVNLSQIGGMPFAMGTQTAANSLSITASSNGVFSGITPSGTSGLVSNIVLKASAGALTSINVTSTTVSGAVMVLDATALPANGTVTPKFCAMLTGQTPTSLSLAWGVGTQLQFTNGIVVAFSSGSSCTTLTASATAYITGGAR